jgi:hypothetical protein
LNFNRSAKSNRTAGISINNSSHAVNEIRYLPIVASHKQCKASTMQIGTSTRFLLFTDLAHRDLL